MSLWLYQVAHPRFPVGGVSARSPTEGEPPAGPTQGRWRSACAEGAHTQRGPPKTPSRSRL